MKLQKLRKRFITLIEMMIVMFLIAMITGVIAYNYTGSLEEGKAFKTKNGIEKIRTILDLHLATHPGDSLSDWEAIVKNSPLVKNSDELLKDGWGVKYNVSHHDDGTIEIKSDRFEAYNSKSSGSMFKKDAK